MSIKRDDLDAGREKLKGGLKDFHSIRINDQWRVIFRWIDGEPHEVRIVDYH
ncbi:MAG: toxin HigB [Bradyrhizobium sp.]|jgi:proteic killer suppression protein|nr:toxin HigB [Bradyrhizobium sp.]